MKVAVCRLNQKGGWYIKKTTGTVVDFDKTRFESMIEAVTEAKRKYPDEKIEIEDSQ